MIRKINLENFTVFSKLSLEFSSKINIIIGENSTGKTHLLKAAYWLSYIASELNGSREIGNKKVEATFSEKLVRLFLPLDEKLGKMCRHGAVEKSKMEVHFGPIDSKIVVCFHSRSRSVLIPPSTNYGQSQKRPVFIPTKEVLSLVKGISSTEADSQTVKNIFDDTYLDLCNLLLESNETDATDRIDFDPRFGSVFPDLVNVVGGKYLLTNGKFCFQKGKYEEKKVRGQHRYGDKKETVFKPVTDADLSNNMTAEGFRKIGMLQRLLVNKTLNPGISGPLFWDEPESNMNPKLVQMLVQILLDLSRNGQQIILATHDFVLLKWFDLLMDKGKEDHVRFHALYRGSDPQEILVKSTDNYLEISPNSIADTFSALTDSEISRSMGRFGK